MKKFIFVIISIICININVNADDNKGYKVQGTTYSSTGRVKHTSTPVSTGCSYVDAKGASYPIFVSDAGSCYIIKTSKKSGKKYKYYLGPEISKDICKKINKEYKGKK